MSQERSPGPRRQTTREALREALLGSTRSLAELSTLLRVSEKDLPTHLEHLDRSLDISGERLEITPARCLACGFVFSKRERFSRPGKCPECRATRITAPRVTLRGPERED